MILIDLVVEVVDASLEEYGDPDVTTSERFAELPISADTAEPACLFLVLVILLPRLFSCLY